jgi:uncharacterized protein YqiB (DUF1249 family)
MMDGLCRGAAATTVCLARVLGSLDDVPDFWVSYQQIGRSAIGPGHKTSFVDSVRYTTVVDVEFKRILLRWPAPQFLIREADLRRHAAVA